MRYTFEITKEPDGTVWACMSDGHGTGGISSIPDDVIRWEGGPGTVKVTFDPGQFIHELIDHMVFANDHAYEYAREASQNLEAIQKEHHS